MKKTTALATKINKAELQQQAMALKGSGHTYEEIASQLGISLSKAYRAVQSAMLEVNESLVRSVTQYRCVELAKLDYLEETAMRYLEEVEEFEDGGSKTRINTNVLAGLLKIQERRAKLCGLDAPVKHEVNSTHAHVIAAAVLPPQASDIDAWIAQNEANIIDAVVVNEEAQDEQGG